MEFEEFLERVSATMADPDRKAPARLAEIDQWLAGFDELCRQVTNEAVRIQEREKLARGEYIDMVVTALMMQEPDVPQMLALFGALTWELGLCRRGVSR